MSKNYRTIHKAKGLCSVCPNPVVPGRTRCDIHINSNREYRKKQIKQRREEGRCIVCGDLLYEEIDNGHVKCLLCREERTFPKKPKEVLSGSLI